MATHLRDRNVRAGPKIFVTCNTRTDTQVNLQSSADAHINAHNIIHMHTHTHTHTCTYTCTITYNALIRNALPAYRMTLRRDGACGLGWPPLPFSWKPFLERRDSCQGKHARVCMHHVQIHRRTSHICTVTSTHAHSPSAIPLSAPLTQDTSCRLRGHGSVLSVKLQALRLYLHMLERNRFVGCRDSARFLHRMLECFD